MVQFDQWRFRHTQRRLEAAFFAEFWSYPQPNITVSAVSLSPYQLYNLASDPGETRNLYKEQQEIARELEALMLKYIEDGRSTPGVRQRNDGAETGLDHWKRPK